VEPDREEGLNEYARAGIVFARKQLSNVQKNWLGNRPLQLDFDDFTAVHASLSDEEPWHYVLGPADAQRHFLFQEKPLCFCGHSHRPGVWTLEGSEVRGIAPRDNVTVSLGARTLVNVGSVGQPRNRRAEACDGIDNRAALSIRFRFISYNVKQTQWKS